MMKISINNIDKEVDKDITLTALIDGIENLPQSGYAVAVNNTVISRDKRDEYILSENDKIMIIRAFYGG